MVAKPSSFGSILAGVTDPSVRRALQLTAERLQVWDGSRGNPLDRVVTLRDLTSGTDALNIIRGSAADGLNGSPLVDSIRWGDRTPPPAPVNLQAQGAFNNIVLSCEFPMSYPWLSHFEWWRATTDNLGTASLVKISVGPLTSDQVDTGSSFYYWVRAVALGAPPILGPFNSASGTLGQTDMDPAYLLEVLTSAITATQLHSSLASPIASIGTLQTAVDGALAEIESINATLSDINSVSAFSSGTSYAVDDMFTSAGHLYRVKVATTAPSPSPPNATYYEQIGDYASLSEAVSAHAATLSDHETRISSTEGDVTTLASNYSAVSAGLSTANSNISANAAAITAAQAAITSLNGTVSAHTSSINTLNSSLATTNGTLSGVASTLSGVQATVTSQGNTLTSHTSSINSMSATVAGHTTSINTQAAQLTSLNSTVTTQGSTIIALSSSVTAMQATVGTDSAAIAIEAAVRAAATAPNYSSAASYGLNSLVVYNSAVYRGKANGIPVGTLPTNTTYWEPYTTTSAQYTLKLDVNGKVTGFGLENTGISSLFEIVADRFAVVTSTGAGAVAPFIVSGSSVYMNTAVIQTASISVAKMQSAFMDSLVAAQGTLATAHLGDTTITTAKLANVLQSANYAAGSAGWMIDKAGAMEINNITARGTITASDVLGSFISASQMASTGLYTAGSHLKSAVTAGATTITLKDVSSFGTSGSGIVYDNANNRDAFSWTGRNTATNQLTGCTGLLAHAAGATVLSNTHVGLVLSPLTGEIYMRADDGAGTVREVVSLGVATTTDIDTAVAVFGTTLNAASVRRGMEAYSGAGAGALLQSVSGPGVFGLSNTGPGGTFSSVNGIGASFGGGMAAFSVGYGGDESNPHITTRQSKICSVLAAKSSDAAAAKLFFNTGAGFSGNFGATDSTEWREFMLMKPVSASTFSGSLNNLQRGLWWIRRKSGSGNMTVIKTVNGSVASTDLDATGDNINFWSDGTVDIAAAATVQWDAEYWAV